MTTDHDGTAEFAARRLQGEPPPADLAALLAHRKELFERTGFQISLDTDWAPWSDTSYLSPSDLENPDIAENLQAMSQTNAHIQFVLAHEDGEYLGYWRGPEKRPIADSPLVLLDNEGQYRSVSSSVGMALLELCGSDEHALKDWLESIGALVSSRMSRPSIESPAMFHARCLDRLRQEAPSTLERDVRSAGIVVVEGRGPKTHVAFDRGLVDGSTDVDWHWLFWRATGAWRGFLDEKVCAEACAPQARPNGLLLSAVQPDSFVYAMGLRTGDLIVDVDGDTDACARLRTQPQRAVLAIKRGVGRHAVTFSIELEAIQVPPAATADVWRHIGMPARSVPLKTGTWSDPADAILEVLVDGETVHITWEGQQTSCKTSRGTLYLHDLGFGLSQHVVWDQPLLVMSRIRDDARRVFRAHQTSKPSPELGEKAVEAAGPADPPGPVGWWSRLLSAAGLSGTDGR
jgi:hypothetical protein